MHTMKKRINLFSRKKRFNAFAAVAAKVKKAGTIAGVLLFGVFIFVIIQTFSVRSQLQDLTKKKQLYLTVLSDEKDTEANIRYFKGKQTQLVNFEKDDARFVPYYSVLLGVLHTSSTQSAALDTVEIDHNRNTSFIVKFNDNKSMLSFLKYVESDEFLNNFESLSLESLSLSMEVKSDTANAYAKKSSRNFQLQFEGKFKELNDKKF